MKNCSEDSFAWRLRNKITIQQLTQTPDGGGGFTESWTTYKTVYAAVEPLRGRELFAADQVQSKVSHRIRIRYTSGITSKMRVQFQSTRYFRIDSVLNIEERNQEIQLMCQEVADP